MSARREAAAVIRFDELLTGYALAEDEDFSYRLSRLGRVRYVPSISIWHEQHGVRTDARRSTGCSFWNRDLPCSKRTSRRPLWPECSSASLLRHSSRIVSLTGSAGTVRAVFSTATASSGGGGSSSTIRAPLSAVLERPRRLMCTRSVTNAPRVQRGEERS